MEPTNLLARQRVTQTVEAQTGFVEDLIGVEIADTDDEGVVEQQGLEFDIALQERPAELGPRHRFVDRIKTVILEFGDLVGKRSGVDDEHLGSAAGIHQTKLTVLGEGDDHLGGVLDLVLVGVSSQRAGRAEVDHQGRVTVEHDEEMKPTPTDAGDLHVIELAGECLAVLVALEHGHARRLDRLHLLADQVAIEFTANRLDLG